MITSTRLISQGLLQRSKFITNTPQTQRSLVLRRKLSTKKAEVKDETVKVAAEPESWWTNARWWGAAGAAAGWGMSGAAIYDAAQSGPEIISLNMTGVLIVYSSLFAKWAYVVKPRNMALCLCHVTNVLAQANQFRRALEYKIEQGEEDEVKDIAMKAAATAAGGAACVLGGPVLQAGIVNAEMGLLSALAAADAGPFTVHFWAPMSKWLISGANFLDLDRPIDKISLPQYTALTLTGFFFSRYSLLVKPINYILCSVNIALFGSSAWHLGRKVNADYIEGPKEAKSE